MDNIRFPAECEAIVDVTKSPYFADNTGKKDVTEILRKVIDDICTEYEHNFNATKEKLLNDPDPNALISFEIRKIDGVANVIFAEEQPKAKIIYFPNGVYKVSDTISYFKEEYRNILNGVRGMEMNCNIHIMGESRENTIIRLTDNAKGFEYGGNRPVLSLMQGEMSNISMMNTIENITVDVGSGNPGAIGVIYFANNTGAVRNLRIVSSDPNGRGHIGYAILHDKVSASYAKNIEVIGFDYGIKVECQTQYTVFEHIRCIGQRRAGFWCGNAVVSMRDYYSENSAPGVKIVGVTAFMNLIDAKLVGGDPLEVAVKKMAGECYLRNVVSDGYKSVLPWPYDKEIAHYVTHGPIVPNKNPKATSFALPIEETPEVPWDDPETWVSVNSFGAKGDGITDDTDSIRRAFNSGTSTVYFNPGKYLVNGSISVPSTLNRINFMYSDMLSGDFISKQRDTGIFVIDGESENPVIIEDMFAWEKFYGYMSLIDHASRRTLIVSDVHAQAASIYFNSVSGGKVFFEDTGDTIGGVPGAGLRKEKLSGEEKFEYDRSIPCFKFTNQTVYCRQINPERSLHEIVNDGGNLWILGFKTEEEGTAFETKNGGKTEVLGGIHVGGINSEVPLIINDNSTVAVFSAQSSPSLRFPNVILEKYGDNTSLLKQGDMPIRYMNEFFGINCYIGLPYEE